MVGQAGGNFYILAPNLRGFGDTLAEIQRDFEAWTLDHMRAGLSISLAAVDLSGKELTNFALVLDERLKPALQMKKYQPHHSVLTADGRWVEDRFLRAEVIEGEEEVCTACRKDARVKSEKNDEGLCGKCLADVQIGTALTRAQYLVFFDSDVGRDEILGWSFELWDAGDLVKNRPVRPYLMFRLNSTQIVGSADGFKYVTTYVPTDDSGITPSSFDQIASASTGSSLLGYLKGDVDNLGEILRKGFDSTKPSVSRFSAFSQMLEIFFAGHLGIRIESDFKDIYTVYSGGDDFFLIGPWNQAIEFAHAVRSEFLSFCANNGDLTFSCGIFLAKPHEPLSFCASMVETELKKAKDYLSKDRITIFNQPLTWDELVKVIREARRVIEWMGVKPPIVSRGLAHNLRAYGNMYQLYRATKETGHLRFVPALAYDIKRNLARRDQETARLWAASLSPGMLKEAEEDNLPFLRTIMEYVLTFTRR